MVQVMGLKVMRWNSRSTKKYQVNILVHKMEGLTIYDTFDEAARLFVVVRWKGPKGGLKPRFTTKRGSSRPMPLGIDGAVEWDEGFDNVCTFSTMKDGAVQYWPVSISVCKAVSHASKLKPFVVGTLRVDLGELVTNAREPSGLQMYPINCTIDGVSIEACLSMSFNFVENRALFEGFESVHKLMAPAIACMGEPFSDSDDQESIGIRKKGHLIRGFTLRSPKKSPIEEEVTTDEGKLSPDRSEGKFSPESKSSPDRSEGKFSPRSKSSPDRSEGKFSPRSDRSLPDSDNQFDSDSIADSELEEYIEAGEDDGLQKSFSYGTIAGANLVAEEVIPFHRDRSMEPLPSNAITVHSRASSGAFPKTDIEEPPTEADPQPNPISMKSMLSWRKRKLSFRSPRSRGEPLLNKAYGEEGGDEIDWDRRQSQGMSPEDKPLLTKHPRGESLSATTSDVAEYLDFGEMFTVGSWEKKDLLSRDGHIKLSANVFFASFDQRSESAAGESACTALVAVIADWLHAHPGLSPSKTEFDMLIRDGSSEWRKLCEVEAYKDRFPDRHFDLETVLEAGVRPLSVCPERSFVGFFVPESVYEMGEAFDFLKHAMTFDGIWDEIERSGPALYIVSWNDHFFVLRVEEDCCYIIDTLGERLYEGCNQAYILHFDETATLCNAPPKPSKESKVVVAATTGSESAISGEKGEKGEKSKGSKALVAVATTGTEGALSIEKGEKSKGSKAVVAAAVTTGAENAVLSETVEKSKGTAAEGTAVKKSKSTEAEVAALKEVPKIVYGGKGACRQFVKRFFAAIQLREIESLSKKGSAGKFTQTQIYQKLQIEFHFAQALGGPVGSAH